jgi:hypothetical protein
LSHPTLSAQEKRAVLASWASDAHAVEAAPQLRWPPGAAAPVQVADILEALRMLDGDECETGWTGRDPAPAWPRARETGLGTVGRPAPKGKLARPSFVIN